ncbi:COPII subunit [Tieghemiomyces parasiticus]|uniref:COPII subunit n=1 Tax=Tieghemiomyces parasiticus TaxID=78921 RepID=A0A9W8DM05_9FUNG|nr:COPII subunit [Tieghemiomyces parasiticus]
MSQPPPHSQPGYAPGPQGHPGRPRPRPGPSVPGAPGPRPPYPGQPRPVPMSQGRPPFAGRPPMSAGPQGPFYRPAPRPDPARTGAASPIPRPYPRPPASAPYGVRPQPQPQPAHHATLSPPGTPRSPTSLSGSTSGHAARRRLYPDQITTAYTQPSIPAGLPPQQPMSSANAAYPAAAAASPQFFVPGADPQRPTPAHPQPPHGQPAPYAAANDLTQSFNQMGFAGVPTSLLAGPPEIWALDQPPAPVVLPPQTAAVPHAVPCAPSHIRSTLAHVPNSAALLKKSKLLFGLTFTPFKTPGPGEPALPTIGEIVRCRRCRAYFSPYVTFTDGGHLWVCNLCFLKNEVPPFFDYDAHRQIPVDRFERPELTHAVVEYLAPDRYMSRPPQPPVYVFILDVSHAAVANGSLGTVARALAEGIDRIPNGDGRALVAFLTVDTSLHFYSMSPGSTEPQMLAVPDLTDTFIPYPSGLLVNLAECRPAVDALLGRLGEMFQGATGTGFALGPALSAARRLMQHVGGKIVVCHSTLPNLAAGALKPRGDATPGAQESELLKPADGFYSGFIQQVLGVHIAVDLFTFGPGPADLATLAPLAKTSGGELHRYPDFLATRPDQVARVHAELGQFLARETGWEAVLRIRASPGIRFPAYYGHHFLRGTDLITLPNVNPDLCFAADASLEADLTGTVAFFQSALLYTTIHGERRVRVATLALPVVSTLRDVFRGVDQIALAALLAKKAVDRAISARLEDARKAVEGKTREMVHVDRAELGLTGGAMGQLPVPRTLNLLPLLALALLKHDALRPAGPAPISSDERIVAIFRLLTLSPEALLPHLVPRFFALHELPAEAGRPDPSTGLTTLPPMLNPTSERLVRHGVYLLFSTDSFYVWLGRDVHPDLARDLLGAAYHELTSGPLQLPRLETDISQRVQAIMDHVVALTRHAFAPQVTLVKEDAPAPLRSLFHNHLVEDKTAQLPSYQQYLAQLRDQRS